MGGGEGVRVNVNCQLARKYNITVLNQPNAAFVLHTPELNANLLYAGEVHASLLCSFSVSYKVTSIG